MRIFSFNLILAMDFLNKIAEFLTVTVAAEPTAKLKEEVRSVKSIDKPSDSIAVS